MCVHGGLSPDIKTIDQIRTIERNQEIPHKGAFCGKGNNPKCLFKFKSEDINLHFIALKYCPKLIYILISIAGQSFTNSTLYGTQRETVVIVPHSLTLDLIFHCFFKNYFKQVV